MLILIALLLFAFTVTCRAGMSRARRVGHIGEVPFWRLLTSFFAMALAFVLAYLALAPLFPPLGEIPLSDFVWPVTLTWMGAFSIVVAFANLANAAIQHVLTARRAVPVDTPQETTHA